MESGNKYCDSGDNNDHHQPEKSSDDETKTGGRSYDCTFCKRGFTNAQALGGHMNIHRKDKAKAKQNNSKESSSSISPRKSNYCEATYNNSSWLYSSAPPIEVPHYPSSYQVYLPPSPTYHQNAYSPFNSQVSPGPDGQPDRHGDLNLSLNFGVHHGEYGERRYGNEDESEVDLELRLGHHR